LILQNIENQSELGKTAQEMLLRGEAIPATLVSQMIENKLNSPEVMHHGIGKFVCEAIFHLIKKLL
jgi:adenylate/nucleoside-diphosphate kinase